MRRFLRFTGWLLLALIGLMGIGFGYVHFSTRISPPISSPVQPDIQVVSQGDQFFTYDHQWLKKNAFGLWEMYVEGTPFHRGLSHGKLAVQLVQDQESAFADQISEMIPYRFYRFFLKYFILWFNRSLDQFVPEEYKEEIQGISLSASPEFDQIGPAYQRMLNYHAAHDIGHALQNLALVGCTSFAAWGDYTDDGELLVGRNFDFYVGDRFAENKIVQFTRPDQGHPFMMITWGGMVGVVSGMNMAGLTVTLNAAKSTIPSGSATPVSILAREILQYASTIDEAIAIAKKRKTFVSETFLIGSARDRKAVSIEKTPETLDIYDPNQQVILCTNHFESPGLKLQPENQAHIRESASGYRMKRLAELVDQLRPLNTTKTAQILRDPNGMKDKSIGLGNERAVNQFICHHSILFKPESRTVWISTDPWNLGDYIAYNLDSVFSATTINATTDLTRPELRIQKDSILNTEEYANLLAFKQAKQEFMHGHDIDAERISTFNPDLYTAWELAGDQFKKRKQWKNAANAYTQALEKEIATSHERTQIQEKLAACQSKLNTR